MWERGARCVTWGRGPERGAGRGRRVGALSPGVWSPEPRVSHPAGDPGGLEPHSLGPVSP